MNTHRNDVWRTDDPPCDKHFQMPGHNFNVHAMFTIIEEVHNKQHVRTWGQFLDFEIANSFPARPKHIT